MAGLPVVNLAILEAPIDASGHLSGVQYEHRWPVYAKLVFVFDVAEGLAAARAAGKVSRADPSRNSPDA